MASKPASAFEMVLSVTIVCVLAAAGLAGTYALTKDRIAAQEKQAQDEALGSVLSDAETFEVRADLLDAAVEAGGETPVAGVFEALDGSGATVGWGLRVAPRGYGGPIQMVVGLDRDGLVTGVKVISMNETPGLGTRIVDEPEFLEGFVGVDSLNAEDEIRQLDAITGATKSSRGARHGVEAACAVYAQVLGEGAGQ